MSSFNLFIGNKLYDKKFIFKANSINEKDVEEVPIFVDGVIDRIELFLK
jgi:hypothetical protein